MQLIHQVIIFFLLFLLTIYFYFYLSIFIDHATVTQFIKTHITNLRKVPIYQQAIIYVYIEGNLNWLSADEVGGIIRNHDDKVELISRDPTNAGRIGVYTGETEKKNYADILLNVLQKNQLVFADCLTGQNIQRDCMMLEKQMRMFREEIHTPADLAFGKFKYTYSGKTPTEKDDLILTSQIALFQSHLTRIDPQFKNKWKGYRT